LRPQYHWTDQKIAVHALICLLALLLATAAYAKARKEACYQKDLSAFLDDLARIRLVSVFQRAQSQKGRPKISRKLEQIPPALLPLVQAFNIHA